MKHLSTVLSIIAIVLSGAVLCMQYSGKGKTATGNVSTKASSADSSKREFRMAYFDIDSLQNNYEYYKDALNELKGKEQAMNNELAALTKSYQKKIADWQQKSNSMTQSEAEAANREYQQMEQNYQQTKFKLDQQLGSLQMEYKKNIKEKIELFLKDYNKDNKYTYIISYEPELMFYKDSTYNITADLIKGLNASYEKKTTEKKDKK